jgi:membrane protease YdiL (CAAX protease family)
VGKPSSKPVVWFFVLACVLSGVGQCVHLYVSHRLAAGVPAGTPIDDTPIMTWVRYAPWVTGTGPSLAGLVVALWLYGLPGVRRLALQLTPWSVGRAWPVLAVCLLLPLGVIVLPIAILAALGASVRPPSWEGLSTYLYGAVIGGGLIGPGLFEEIGWRGFALPHLQRRYSALASSLIIGLVWAFWHWPNFVIPSDRPPWWHVVAFVPLTMAVSVVFTWVFNSTRGSLFAVVLLHGAICTALGLCDAPDSGVAAREDVVALLLFAAIAVGLVWRYGAANLSGRHRIVAEPDRHPVQRLGPPSAEAP